MESRLRGLEVQIERFVTTRRLIVELVPRCRTRIKGIESRNQSTERSDHILRNNGIIFYNNLLRISFFIYIHFCGIAKFRDNTS